MRTIRGGGVLQVELARCRICGPVDPRVGTGNDDCTHGDEDVSEALLDIEWEGYDDPGRTYGEPGDCYPPDSERNVLDVSCGGMPVDLDALASWELDYIDQLLDELELDG